MVQSRMLSRVGKQTGLLPQLGGTVMSGESYNTDNLMDAKVSVIVPIYNVERFVQRCVRSLMEQTLQEVEFVFVDDATPDNSLQVLEKTLIEYPHRKGSIKIVHHPFNQGLPAARNTGLEASDGEYIFHCDSDDYVEADMLEVLYGEARRNDADIVWCDWFLTFGKRERYMKQPDYATPLEAVKAMLGGSMKFNVWNKLVKRELYQKNGIAFPAGHSMGEDMTMILPFLFAKRVKYVPRAFYHYVKTNPGAFTQSHSAKHLDDLQYNANRIENVLRGMYGTAFDKEISFLKLEIKFPLLIMGSRAEQYRQWKDLYPEANRYISQNTYISFRSRALEWCAWKGQWWLIRLYYWMVIRFIYGIIYR